MKKFLKKFIVIFVILCVISVLYYYQIYSPIKIEGVRVTVMPLDESDLDAMRHSYNDVYNGGFEAEHCTLLRLNGKFPEGDEKDFRVISIDLKINNRSIFSQNDIRGYITTGSEDSRMLSCTDNLTTDFVRSFKNGEACPVFMDLYTGGLTDEEIVDYVLQQEIKLYYNNALGSKTEIISLKDIRSVETDIRKNE